LDLCRPTAGIPADAGHEGQTVPLKAAIDHNRSLLAKRGRCGRGHFKADEKRGQSESCAAAGHEIFRTPQHSAAPTIHVPISRVNPPLGSCLWGPRRPRSGSVTDPLRKGGSKLSVSEKRTPCRHSGAASTRIGATRRPSTGSASGPPNPYPHAFSCNGTWHSAPRLGLWIPGSPAGRQKPTCRRPGMTQRAELRLVNRLAKGGGGCEPVRCCRSRKKA
jgi:hypothetical protein